MLIISIKNAQNHRSCAQVDSIWAPPEFGNAACARNYTHRAYSPVGLLKRRRQVVGCSFALHFFLAAAKKSALPAPLCFNARTGSVVVFEVGRRGHTQNAYYVRRASCGGSSRGPAARFFLCAEAPRPNLEPDWHV
jgi:hypothetical protein